MSDKVNPPVQQSFLERLKQDGVIRPAGFRALVTPTLFFACIPLTTRLASSGIFSTLTSLALLALPKSGPSSDPSTHRLLALSTLYFIATYVFASAGSISALASGRAAGRSNKQPRAHIGELTGLPLRLYSAHVHMMEHLGGFALMAGLAVAMGKEAVEEVGGLLGLHVLAKVFVYYPAYVLNIGILRTMSHVLATACLMNVGLKLTRMA